jgi:pre-60S factor REI1
MDQPNHVTPEATKGCVACACTLDGIEEQRAHYRTEWHRHNLKRKVAGLASVTREQFERRVAVLTAPSKNAETGKQVEFCQVCNKTYRSKNAMKQHLNSNSHFERAGNSDYNAVLSKPASSGSLHPSSRAAALDRMKDMTEEEAVAEKIRTAHRFELGDCLFCSFKSPTIERQA